MTRRQAAPEPIEFDEPHSHVHFLTGYRVPIDAEVAPDDHRPVLSGLCPWVARFLILAAWVGLLWLLGWFITDAEGGWVVAVIGGVALLPYLVMTGGDM